MPANTATARQQFVDELIGYVFGKHFQMRRGSNSRQFFAHGKELPLWTLPVARKRKIHFLRRLTPQNQSLTTHFVTPSFGAANPGWLAELLDSRWGSSKESTPRMIKLLRFHHASPRGPGR